MNVPLFPPAEQDCSRPRFFRSKAKGKTMDWNNPLTTLISVAIGWGLSELSNWWRSKREWSRRLNELKIENYAEWAAGMDANLVAYATQTSGSQSSYNVPLCEKRLLLIERDPELRRLIREVHDSIPASFSEDYEDLRMDAHTNEEWDWVPYRQKMDKLLDHVRQKLS